MQKYLPFVFPLAALVIVLFLAFRWFSAQTENPANDIGEGVQIEDLTAAEQESIIRGTGDFQQVTLENQVEEVEAQGAVRYEMQDDRIAFSVVTDLAQPTEGFYQVWLVSQDATQKAFRLQLLKGGLSGSAAVSQSVLPFEVVVSHEMTDDNTVERVLLRGEVTE